MMRGLMVILATFAVMSCAGCPVHTPSPSVVDAGSEDAGPDADTLDAARTLYSRACAHLASLGCAEGSESNCATTLEHAMTTHLIAIHPTCLVSAPSKAAARACGGVTCP